MDLNHFRQKLAAERQFYAERMQMIEETGFGWTSQRDQLQEDTSMDNHIGDLGTEMFERSKDLGLLNNAERQLREIDLALERMASGLYGICMDCGGPIAQERLEVAPSATTCIDCKRLRETEPDLFPRPVEEKVLTPPFGRTFRDGTGDPGYDGEDAWQDVAVYGTSESTQDNPDPRRVTEDLYKFDEEVYSIVEPVEGLVDEEGEPIGDRIAPSEYQMLYAVPETEWRVGLFSHPTHYVRREKR